jgi:hypothetical protein
MNYIVVLTYIDDKTLNVSLPKDEVSKFLEKMQNNETYWAKGTENAFWTPTNQIRFVNIMKEQGSPVVVEEAKEEEVSEVVEEK